MKPLYYFIIVDLALILIGIKIIFGSIKLFFKALFVHIFSDFEEDSKTLSKWKINHDLHHKINILYAVALGVGIVSFAIYFNLYGR